VGLPWIFQRRLIYQPGTSPVQPASQMWRGGVDVLLRTDKGLALGAW